MLSLRLYEYDTQIKLWSFLFLIGEGKIDTITLLIVVNVEQQSIKEKHNSNFKDVHAEHGYCQKNRLKEKMNGKKTEF